MPIMKSYSRKDKEKYKNIPDSIPMSIMESHEPRAIENHGQTLQRLAERGGLAPEEAYCILKNLNLRVIYNGKLNLKKVELFLRKVVGLND